MKTLSLLGCCIAGSTSAMDLSVQTPAAIRGQSAAITCRFQLGAGEVFSSLQVYKNDKTDPANHFAVIKSLDEAETDQNWLANERLSFQITQDEVEKLVTVSVNTVEDTDKGSYHCQLDYSTDESPLEITSDTSSDLDVYFPPTSLNMSSKMLEDGTIEITCTTDQSYPATSIGVNIDAVTEADVPMGKLFTYALSPVDNNKDIACTATQTALVAPLTEQITLLGPSLPSEGELIDELTLDGVSFNNNGKLVTGVTSDSTPGALNLVTAEFGPPVNGSACQVSLKADAGIAFPSVEYTWYVDSEQRTAGLAYVFEVSALDTISIATVIASSPLGKSAVQIDFQNICFPPPPPSTTTVSAEPGTPVNESESGGQFSVDENVDVSTVESLVADDSATTGTNASVNAFNLSDDEAISEASMSGPIIAAIAGGSFVGLLLIGVALYFLCFKKPDGESYRTNDKTHPDDEDDYGITGSVDLNDVVQVAQKPASVKRSLSGTWNKPQQQQQQQQQPLLIDQHGAEPQSPKRTISTQTLEGKVSSNLD